MCGSFENVEALEDVADLQVSLLSVYTLCGYCVCYRMSIVTYIVKRYIVDIANLSPKSHQMLCKLASRYVP